MQFHKLKLNCVTSSISYMITYYIDHRNVKENHCTVMQFEFEFITIYHNVLQRYCNCPPPPPPPLIIISCYNNRISVNGVIAALPSTKTKPPLTNMVVLLSGTAQSPTLPTLMSPTEIHLFVMVL